MYITVVNYTRRLSESRRNATNSDGTSMELEALDPAKAINLQRDLETVEQFAERNGLEEGVVRAWVYRGNLPTTKIGKRRLINSALLRQSLLEEEWVR